MCTDRLTPLLQDVLDCVEARYETCEAPWFCRVGITAGVPVWDNCCSCDTGEHEGQLWVRVVEWNTDPNFEQPNVTGCQQPSMVTVGVGALRCVPRINENGTPPDPNDETEAAALIYGDAQRIRDAVMCCVEERVWTGWTPLGWDGGCGGGEHTFQLPFLPCMCDDEPVESP